MEPEPDFLPLPQAIDNKGMPGGATPDGITRRLKSGGPSTLPPPSWLGPLPPSSKKEEVIAAPPTNIKAMKPLNSGDHQSPLWFFGITLITVSATCAAAYLYITLH